MFRDMRTAGRSQAGFTLIELAAGMVVLGILLALGAPAWQSYLVNQESRSAAGEVVSVLRNAQVHATSEETGYSVTFAAADRTMTVRRAGVVAKVVRLDGTRFTISGVAFTNSAADASTVYFTPRGTASPGQVLISRTGGDVKHTVTVEGLTGRVSWE